MKKITQLNLNGWAFEQWAWAIKWHKDTLGKSDDLAAIKAKWEELNTVQPPTVDQLFETDKAAKIFKTWLGENLTGANNLSIELGSKTE